MQSQKQIILATGNQHKAKEIASIYSDFEILNYTTIIDAISIEENGSSFAENASIKAQKVFTALNDKNALVLADDSGLCVQVLDGAPGIYSARFAGFQASDDDNNHKLIELLEKKSCKNSKAFFVCALALTSKETTKIVHGFCHGTIYTIAKGKNGFGYDPLFIPKGFKQSLAEMNSELKNQISHRTLALKLMRYFI